LTDEGNRPVGDDPSSEEEMMSTVHDTDAIGGHDPFDLERFVTAQDDGASYLNALGQIEAGRKATHWMWFIFPQLAGLGRSEKARRFAIGSLDEARAYLAHPILGPRLVRCTKAVLECGRHDPAAIFGSVDALKLRSSMTLFSSADPTTTCFGRVLERLYGGERDVRTEALLGHVEA